jgi:hypothetical protein
MTDEMKIARRVQRSFRRIGIASTIEVKHDMTVVSGKDRKGKPFHVRIGHSACAGMDELDAFADRCDAIRIHPRKPGDLILVRPSDA